MAQTLTQEDLDAIADAVWNEAYNQHTTAGTFGKLMDLIRKANYVVEGEVTAAISPTSLTFASDVNYPTGAFEHAVLLFINGSTVSEQNSPIISYTQTNGVFVLEEALTQAPVAGDEFIVIAGSHVHGINDVAIGVRSVGVAVRATQADDGTISLYDGRRYDGTAHPKLSFTTAKDYAGASSLSIKFYSNTSTSTVFQTAAATRISSTEVAVSSFTVSFSPSPAFTGNPLVFACRYVLSATYGTYTETVSAGDCFLFAQPS